MINDSVNNNSSSKRINKNVKISVSNDMMERIIAKHGNDPLKIIEVATCYLQIGEKVCEVADGVVSSVELQQVLDNGSKTIAEQSENNLLH